ncbi:GH25 family lysozyme [Streptomyces sp. H10-C2]|uniref:GH25 family lysozyme n=1 Tax=unclassified Streptomyces TaxID=2593676 RepID=UPI0024BB13F7|nr:MULTISPECIES: GH25 family lysozyme [unclassified Streptomyces]MDJ0346843.1 GH25 family lysozyme [Streptomyces sp. PH10-H1]MDJ0375366.1 GH25 family lysozyme [Streptomyces sp. H10-C2]
MSRTRLTVFLAGTLMAVSALTAGVFAATPAAAVPSGYTVEGVDTSNNDGVIDWSTSVSAGVKFGWAKASEGDWIDPNFSANYQSAKASGIYLGAYAWGRPDKGPDSGKGQADFLVDHAQNTNDGKTLPPQLDIEWPWWTTGFDCYGLSSSQMVTWIHDFVNEVQDRTGRPGAIYTNTSWWNQCTGGDGSFGANPLEIANYSGSPTPLPPGWSTATAWQYADNGRSRGLPGSPTTFNGTLNDLAFFANGQGNRVTGIGDVFGNGRQSFVSITGDNATLYYGNGTGSYASTVSLGAGWRTTMQIAGVGDFDGRHARGMLALRTDGSLWLYDIVNNAGNAALAGPGTLVTQGFTSATKLAGVGDVFIDGHQSFVAITGDNATLYYGNGHGSYASTISLGAGWRTTTMITGVGYFDNANLGILAYRTDGSAWLYDIYNNGGYAAITTPALVDNGFTGAAAIAGVGNFDGIRGNDFIYVQGAEHALYLVSGNNDGSWRARSTITGGWY